MEHDTKNYVSVFISYDKKHIAFNLVEETNHQYENG